MSALLYRRTYQVPPSTQKWWSMVIVVCAIVVNSVLFPYLTRSSTIITDLS